MLVTGAVLTAVALPMTIGGIAVVASQQTCHGGGCFGGAALLGVGVPLLLTSTPIMLFGATRHADYRRWSRERGHPQPDGRGLLIAGGIMTAASIPLLAIGLPRTIAAANPARACPCNGEAFLYPGAALFEAGVPMLAVGAVRVHRWRTTRPPLTAWTPSVQRSLHGTWLPGVALRF